VNTEMAPRCLRHDIQGYSHFGSATRGIGAGVLDGPSRVNMVGATVERREDRLPGNQLGGVCRRRWQRPGYAGGWRNKKKVAEMREQAVFTTFHVSLSEYGDSGKY